MGGGCPKDCLEVMQARLIWVAYPNLGSAMSIDDRLNQILCRQDKKLEEANAQAAEQLRLQREKETKRETAIAEWRQAHGLLTHAIRDLNERLQGREIRLIDQPSTAGGEIAVQHVIKFDRSSKFVDRDCNAMITVGLEGETYVTIHDNFLPRTPRSRSEKTKNLNLPFFNEVMIDLLETASRVEG